MPNYQLPIGMFDPNSAYAQQMAADEAERQRAAQQIVQQMNQPQAPQQTAVQSAPVVAAQQSVMQPAAMPNNNGLAAKAAGVLTPLDDAGRILASQIAKFKMDYDAAEQAGDTAGMNRAHAGAQAIRDAAGKYGVDVSRLGENANTQAMQAMLQADYARGVADMANMLSPQEYYQQQYQQNIANGMSKRHAQAAALDATEAYEGKRQRELGNAFARYGVNDQGEMNRFGAQIANLMYGQNPQSVALYDQYYANPMQQWKFDKNMEVQDKLYGQKVDFGQHQFDWNRALNNDKFNFQLRLQQNQGDLQKTLLGMQQDFQRLSAEEQRQFYINNPALAMALATKGKGTGNAYGLSKEESKTLQSLENAISQAAQSVENSKSRTEDGNAVEEARSLMEKLYADGKIDKDTYTVAYDRINQLINNRDRKWQRYGYAENIPE